MSNLFINEFISTGMDDYFNSKDENVFESHIIECLCDIYGKDLLKSVYDSRDESKFMEVLKSYGLSNSNYYSFLSHTMNYMKFKWENSVDSSIKSDTASIVEADIISMFLYKCLVSDLSNEEIAHFENDLLNDFNVIKLHFNTSLNPNKTRELWEKKKRIMTESIELVEIKPTYLDSETYLKYGTKLEDVEKMDYRMVEQLNSYIKSRRELELANEPVEEEKKNRLSNIVLTSGNGFVDALMIISIIVTELSIGVIYVFLNMK